MKDLVLSLFKTSALSLWRAYNREFILCAQKLLLHLIGNPGIPSSNYTFISWDPRSLEASYSPFGGSPLIDRGNLKVDRTKTTLRQLFFSSHFVIEPPENITWLWWLSDWLLLSHSLRKGRSSRQRRVGHLKAIAWDKKHIGTEPLR